jgi:hypothetical protein
MDERDLRNVFGDVGGHAPPAEDLRVEYVDRDDVDRDGDDAPSARSRMHEFDTWASLSAEKALHVIPDPAIDDECTPRSRSTTT